MKDLDPDRAAELRAAPFTYPEVGATPEPQPGYLNLTRTGTVASGDLDAAAEALLTWQVQERAGLAVAASSRRATADTVVELRLGAGPVGLRIPCRIVYVVDEADRRGFAYGTLPGHPETGEELFLLERHVDGSVTFTVTAFSRPATFLARAGGPLTRAGQRRMTDRYLRALCISTG
jgi:uncharacterized protein (UPF0548 family)